MLCSYKSTKRPQDRDVPPFASLFRAPFGDGSHGTLLNFNYTSCNDHLCNDKGTSVEDKIW
jgi:hypothetical protein